MPVSESVETLVRPQSPVEPPPQEDKAEIAEKIRSHRQALNNIEMHRGTGKQVIEDDTAEERHLDALVALGAKLTAEELHRKAIHVAMREAEKRREPLTEALVAQVKRRLEESQKLF